MFPLILFWQGDLSRPETIPATLVGIHTVIDCATGRPEEPIRTVCFVWYYSFLVDIILELSKGLAYKDIRTSLHARCTCI